MMTGWIPVILVLIYGVHSTSGTHIPLAPSMTNEAYSQDGDLIIGAIYSARDRSNDVTDPCGGTVSSARLQENIEAITYYIDQANNNDTVLSNVTIGFRIIDDCRRSVTALAKAVQFVSTTEDACPSDLAREDADVYSVVGVLGPTSSSRAIQVSNLLGMYHIPVISPEATSDTLTDSFDHAYFFRLVPPDAAMATAMMAFIEHFGWSYISLLYMKGAYGTNFANNIQQRAEAADICIAYAHEFPDENLDADYFDSVVGQLVKHREAKVVIIILDVDHAPGFFTAVRRANAANMFQWIGSDSFDDRSYTGYEDVALGGITFTIPLGYASQFADYFGQLNPMASPNNPWLHPLWPNIFPCSWENGTCDNYRHIRDSAGYYFSEWTSRTIDSLHTLLLALDSYVNAECSQYIHNASLLRCCVEGPRLREYLLNVTFQGLSGDVAFDRDGNLLGDFIIRQLVLDGGETRSTEIGLWKGQREEIQFSDNVQWFLGDVYANTVPDSICSLPCEFGEIYIQRELPCCWECLSCRENEIIQNNSTVCMPCDLFYWPNPSLQECQPIPPTYIRWNDAFGIVLALFPCTGILVTVIVSFIFIRHRATKIIKASSRSLMVIVFLGVYLAFTSAMTFVEQPSTHVCSFGHVGFHMSCTLLYAPLCVKTTRIYRIVRASKAFRQPKRLVSDGSQLGLTIWLIVIQVALILGTVILGNSLAHQNEATTVGNVMLPSRAGLQMPVLTEPLVELFCERPQIKLLPPLAFNMLLLLCCAVLAFLTRHLPEAFNEAWYIFLSVSATVVVWSAFIPAYFLMFYAYYRETLLSLSLSLNAVCNVLLLFLPKVYAIYWVPEDNISTSFQMNHFGTESRMTKRAITTVSNGDTLHIASTSDENRC